MSEGAERTEDPTPKRLRDAIAKGDVLQSRELSTALTVSAGCGAILFIGPWLVEAAQRLLVDALSFDAGALRHFAPGDVALRLVALIAAPLAALLAIAALGSVAPSFLLGSLHWREKAIAPRWGKLNPLTGLKRMVNASALNELAKAIAKSLLVGTIGVVLVLRHARLASGAQAADAVAQIGAMAGELRIALIALCGGLILIALADVPVQFLLRRGRLRMSKQEVKDEHRQSEGSPELRAQIRRRQIAILSRSARQAVREASVVLANPSHYAVALRYDPRRDAAPVIVARGCDAKAWAIRLLAESAKVEIVTHPVLTRAIYFTGKEGQAIPVDLYQAVAAVLAFIAGVNRRAADAAQLIAVPEGWHFDSEGRRT